MNVTGKKDQELIPPELEKNLTKFEQISLTPAPTLPSFVVSEKSSEHFSDTKQASKSQKKKPNMAIRIGRGGAGRGRGRLVSNVEVLQTMQQIQA